MSKSKYALETPIGRVRTVAIGTQMYFAIKDICVGIGLKGHSPWSWHASSHNNRDRFYKRYDLNRRRESKSVGAKDTVTVITLEGLNDYLNSPYINRKPRAIMFKAWLDAYAPLKEATTALPDEPERLDDMFEESNKTPATEPARKQEKQWWHTVFFCPNCDYMTASPTNFCPNCGFPLSIPKVADKASEQ